MALLDVVGAVVGVAALALGGWQLRVAVLDRRDARSRRAAADPGPPGADRALPVSVPFGRLPAEVLGRDDLLAELDSSLSGVRRRRPPVWVLAGLGGVGKSTVALRVAARARGRGWPVWWVNAADPLSLRGGVLEILRQLGAPDAVVREVREGAATAADRFWTFVDGTVRRAVLIFDNADEPALLSADGATPPGDGTGWVRPGTRVHLVVTTRTVDRDTWGSWASLRVLTALDGAASAQVLRRLAPGVDDPTGREAAALAERLGGLPLALHLAGTYLASPFARWRTFGAYQQALDSAAVAEVIADLDAVRPHGRVAVSRTWELSLDALTARGIGRARGLLHLLSCLAPATPIPGSLLRPEAGTAAREDAAALRGLAEVGLIEVADSAEDGSVDVVVHPVVADICRARVLAGRSTDGGGDTGGDRGGDRRTDEGRGATEDGQVMAEAVGLLAAAGGRLDADRPGDWPDWERLLPHVSAAVTWMAPHLEPPCLARLLAVSRAAFGALWGIGRQGGRDGEALARANAAAAARLGETHPDSLAACNDLGIYLSATGAPREAEALLRSVLAGRRGVLGEDHLDTLRTRDALIGALLEQGRFAEAEPLYRGLLTDMTRVLGAEHPETLSTHVDLAWSIGMQQRPAEAADICRRVLDRARRVLGEENPRTLDAWDDLGRWTNEQGDHAAAERLARTLLDVELRVMGPGHQLTLTTRANLARSIADQGRFDEAERLLRACLADMERVLGADHYRAITARRHLADTVAARGGTAEAGPLYAQVLRLQQHRLGYDHPETLLTRRLVAESAGG
ncbi:tetratricopeptide repeat protein [Streptomyces indicus]|uniref:Tetratricopeptide repeat-containing protein n=1 Tax=Streptomyces indicus TaxID=417292 RepID=A0A1G9JUE5_9ACTN|nr:tetratricopeptide repeat protein [Streptomyces indicus]SDL40886.1 Tetratricopeptide repeat-containing protein [Streptomyces indicus]